MNKPLTLGLCAALAACASGIVRDEQVLKKVNPGMTAVEVETAVGAVSQRKATYANGTSSWTYKYNEVNIHKLMHVIFGPDGRVLRVDTEWDPDVYSKKR